MVNPDEEAIVRCETTAGVVTMKMSRVRVHFLEERNVYKKKVILPISLFSRKKIGIVVEPTGV